MARSGRVVVVAGLIGVVAAGGALFMVRGEAGVARDESTREVVVNDDITDAIRRNRRAIERLRERYAGIERTTDDSPGLLMHGLLGHGRDVPVRHESEPISTLDWLVTEASWQALVAGQPLLDERPGGWVFRRGRRLGGSGMYERHPGQLLCYMALLEEDVRKHAVRVPPDGDAITVEDLARAMQSRIHSSIPEASYMIPVVLKWGEPGT